MTATAIADPGLLGSPGDPSLPFGASDGTPCMFAAKAMSDGGALSFTPQDLEVAALVDARFAAR